MASDYDISEAFKAIENELTASMIRNLKRHRAEETKEGYEWSMWQVEQLKSLELYKKENQAKYQSRFESINAQIEAMLWAAKEQGGTEQEQKILREIKKGFPAHKAAKGATAEFFKLNERKLEALIKATTDDMKRAETAVLRRVNDQYRNIIYNAQVYANTGAGTYEKAVDMATKDFLKAGINCIEYANGSRHTIAEYARMTVRTAGKRAYLQGEGEKRKEWGIYTVIVNKRGNPCPKCLPHCGKVYIDDVWSDGPDDGVSPVTGIEYPLLSTAVRGGLYHPNCKDSHTTYFEGISTPPEGSVYTRDEINQIADQYRADQRQQYAERQAEKYERLEKFSLDEENQKRYAARGEEWKQRQAMQNVQSTVKTEKADPFEKEEIKRQIKEIRNEKANVQKELEELEKEEKTFTQKVYFDLSGTQEEMERLKLISRKKKETKKRLDEIKLKIVEKQDMYKSAAEKRIVKSGAIEQIKLSNSMTPEAVDEIESTVYYLKEKYGIMPKGIVYSPIKAPDATANYDWIDDKIYLSNRLTDSEAYLELVKQSEYSHKEYRNHYNIEKKCQERIEKAEKILSDKSIKGYKRSEAIIDKEEAETLLNYTRYSVRENISDCIVHEYGHFIHRHAQDGPIIPKNAYRMKELGGKYINGGWMYDRNTGSSRTGKLLASKISEYATTDPYETFAEGFLALEKGEKIPDAIAEVIKDAMGKAGVKNIAKASSSGIMTSGARITDLFSDEAEEFAKMYYQEIRSFSTDAKRIAANIEKSEKDIETIKNYLFESDFDPDCAIAQSWQRLMSGKDIKKHDRTLIDHELLEMKIKKENPGIEHWKAHEMASKKYNYQKEAEEYYGNLEKHKKGRR